jgi:hypothetical protein
MQPHGAGGKSGIGMLYSRPMKLRGWVVIIAVGLGCAKKDKPASTVGSGSGSGSAPAAVAGDASAATGASDAGTGSDGGTPADGGVAAAGKACIPDGLHVGRIGADLVGCTGDDSACWSIDTKTGAATPHAAAHLPGVGFTVDTAKLAKPGCYEGLCWTVPKRDPDTEVTGIWVAYHPDGKRAAIIDDPAGTVFDLATKKPVATFQTDLGNSLGGLWFFGSFVANAGFDAGPYAVVVYHDAKTGKKAGTFDEFFGGGAGISSTGAFILAADSMTSVTVVDGASTKGKTTKRKVPKPPAGCSPLDPGLDTESDDPTVKACVAFANKHYAPYGGVTLLDDPSGAAAFVGVTGSELFTVDKALVETSRVKLPICPPAPDTDAP